MRRKRSVSSLRPKEGTSTHPYCRWKETKHGQTRPNCTDDQVTVLSARSVLPKSSLFTPQSSSQKYIPALLIISVSSKTLDVAVTKCHCDRPHHINTRKMPLTSSNQLTVYVCLNIHPPPFFSLAPCVNLHPTSMPRDFAFQMALVSQLAGGRLTPERTPPRSVVQRCPSGSLLRVRPSTRVVTTYPYPSLPRCLYMSFFTLLLQYTRSAKHASFCMSDALRPLQRLILHATGHYVLAPRPQIALTKVC